MAPRVIRVTQAHLAYKDQQDRLDLQAETVKKAIVALLVRQDRPEFLEYLDSKATRERLVGKVLKVIRDFRADQVRLGCRVLMACRD